MANIRISNKARQHVRDLLANYNELKKENSDLRQMILYPFQEDDENVGGGKSSKPVFEAEEKAIKLASHEQIKFRSLAIKVIADVLARSTDEAQKIIELKYFSKEPMSWVAIAENVDGYTEDGCRKIERKIVDLIAQRLGW